MLGKQIYLYKLIFFVVKIFIEICFGVIEIQMLDIKISDRISIFLMIWVNMMELDIVKKIIFDDVKKNFNFKIFI